MESPQTFSALSAVLGGGFLVAFLHTALPTHWLPFALAAKARRWRLRPTLAVSAVAALAHVLSTAVLGIVLLAAGGLAKAWLGVVFDRVAGLGLLGVGAWLIWQAVRQRQGVAPGHSHRRPADASAAAGAGNVSDRRAQLALVTLMLMAPCEAFLPVYLSQVRLGWSGFLALTGALAAGTLSGMLSFVSLSYIGVAKIRETVFARLEGVGIGLTLALLGLLTMLAG